MQKQRIIVIGNGMVGHKFIEQFVASPLTEDYELVTFCEEPHLAYDRVHLSEYFAGKTVDDLSLVDDGFYPSNDITVHTNDKVIAIDQSKQLVMSEQGLEIAYDKLVLATGSYPFVPPISGNDREHCLVYRTIDDLEDITAAAKVSKRGVVVGGGLLGLEAANALQNLGLETHVVEFAPNLMAVQVDALGGQVLQDKIESIGVQVHTSKNTVDIVDGENFRHEMQFADGDSLETDIILFSAGIRPRDELALAAGLRVGQRGGVEINDNCQTSNPDIYAIGECALWGGMIYGLVAPGYQMAQVAVDHLLGEVKKPFEGADMSTKLKLLGVDVASLGDCHGRTEGAKSYTFIDQNELVYKKLVVDEQGSKVLGAILIGDADAYGNLLQMALNDMPLPEQPEALILPSVDGEATGMGVDALPETAQICTCNDVSKKDICDVVADGGTTMGQVKFCTQAGTSCGGCTSLVKQILDNELEKQGVEVDKSICEHFQYTRQELFHLIKVEEIKTFSSLLEKYGSGNGCEVCKPAVGSILASLWNEYVLEPAHTGLQDTNDRYLANMQKDGTYSIVPRIPGGEVTPEKLIVLGEVAKEYGLYTKITGGQRVDLFGAQLHQLPVIWERLIDAGFESGHAYGKALRTVKSCVGETWCRYGVQDSMSMTVFIEERYRGIRSPHKLKMAVSGCTRECAEAQSKDVGIIATEKGWNMYVGGNGGMKPRHADLFASDIDTDTLIKYIDRFLMFYIQTADRLQRTSVWLDNLEGGIDYVRKVVIEDSLGLAADFEAQAQHLVDTYQCEWKTTIEDPEKIKRFRHFVNSEATDNEVVFVEERGQIRPATKEEKREAAEV